MLKSVTLTFPTRVYRDTLAIIRHNNTKTKCPQRKPNESRISMCDIPFLETILFSDSYTRYILLHTVRKNIMFGMWHGFHRQLRRRTPRRRSRLSWLHSLRFQENRRHSKHFRAEHTTNTFRWSRRFVWTSISASMWFILAFCRFS